jgi:hypothetical protein
MNEVEIKGENECVNEEINRQSGEVAEPPAIVLINQIVSRQ